MKAHFNLNIVSNSENPLSNIWLLFSLKSFSALRSLVICLLSKVECLFETPEFERVTNILRNHRIKLEICRTAGTNNNLSSRNEEITGIISNFEKL